MLTYIIDNFQESYFITLDYILKKIKAEVVVEYDTFLILKKKGIIQRPTFFQRVNIFLPFKSNENIESTIDKVYC